MVLRKLMHLGLALSVVAGSGVFSSGAVGQTQTTKSAKPKTAVSKASGSKSAAQGGRASSKKAKSRRKDKGQKTPTPDRISEIQTALAKDRSFTNTPNGKWDDPTVEAMRKFQSAHGLNPSGKLDARTLEKLGLGSQTAGIAEPVAPPNSSSRLSSPLPQTSRQ